MNLCSCGSVLREGQRFCAACGAPVVVAPQTAGGPKKDPATVACERCGAQLPVGKKFCRHCGTSTHTGVTVVTTTALVGTPAAQTTPPTTPAGKPSHWPLTLVALLVILGWGSFFAYKQLSGTRPFVPAEKPVTPPRQPIPPPGQQDSPTAASAPTGSVPSSPPTTTPPFMGVPAKPVPAGKVRRAATSESVTARERQVPAGGVHPSSPPTPDHSTAPPPPAAPEPSSAPAPAAQSSVPTQAVAPPALQPKPRVEILKPDLVANPPPPLNPPGVEKPIYTGPASGVIIWSGRLEKNGVLEIAGSQSQNGLLNGGLPGVPVMIDLDTREFAIAEAPSPRNNWTRLVIRSKNRRHTVVTIKWSVLK